MAGEGSGGEEGPAPLREEGRDAREKKTASRGAGKEKDIRKEAGARRRRLGGEEEGGAAGRRGGEPPGGAA